MALNPEQSGFAAMEAADFAKICAGGHSEPIVGWPLGNSTGAKTINAVVFRNQISSIPGIGLSAAPELQIYVTAADWPNPTKGDVFVFADSIGGVVRNHPYARRIKEDPAGFLLELR